MKKIISNGWWIDSTVSSGKAGATIKPQAVSDSCFAQYCESKIAGVASSGQCTFNGPKFIHGYCVIAGDAQTYCQGQAGQVRSCNTAG